jgi:predicted cobalt transporter CbtA
MYVIMGGHVVPFEGKFFLIALVIVRIILNVIVGQMHPKCPLSNVVSIIHQRFVVKLSNTSATFS